MSDEEVELVQNSKLETENKMKIKYLYSTESIETINSTSKVLKVKSLCQEGDDYYFWSQNDRKQYQVSKIRMTDSEDQPIVEQVKINDELEYPDKILAYYPKNQLLFSKSGPLMSYINLKTKETLKFPQSNIKHSIYLPLMKATLFLSKDKQINVFIHSSKQFLTPSTLIKLLLPYSQITKCDYHIDENNDVFIIMACSHTLRKTIHLLLFTLNETPESQVSQNNPRFQFKIIDAVNQGIFKIGDIVNQIKLIGGASQLLILYNNSKLRKISLNHTAKPSEQFRRLELRVKHQVMSIYKIQSMVLLQNKKDVLLQDKNGNIKIVRLSKDKSKANDVNLYFRKNADLIKGEQVLSFQDNLFIVGQSRTEEIKIQIMALIKMKIDKLITYLIEEKQQIQLASNIIRSTGGDSSFISLYKLEKTGYRDLEQLRQFLQQDFKNQDLLFEIIMKKEVGSLESLELIVKKAVNLCSQNQMKQDKLLQLLNGYKRIQLLKKLGIENKGGVNYQKICFIDKIEQLIQTILTLFEDQSESIKHIFKVLETEVILNYDNIFKFLPLNLLEPTFLLEYLPPGKANSTINKFWQNFIRLRPQDQSILEDNSYYIQLAVDYIYKYKQPGKTVRLLQVAAQNRYFIGLTNLAMQALQAVLISDQKNLTDYEKKIGDLFGISEPLNESVRKIEGYFSYAKWIFTLDLKFYQQYLRDLKYFLVDLIGIEDSPFLGKILENHGDHTILFLRDEDLAQLVLDIFFEKLDTNHSSQVHIYIQKMKNLTLSKNQSKLLQLLQKHFDLQVSVFQPYEIKITYQDLLKFQLNSRNDTLIEQVKQQCIDLIDSVIKKSKGVKEQVLQFGRQKTLGQIDQKWLTLLNNLLKLRDSLGYTQQQVDVYQLFLQKLLDNKVTASIEQLIKSDQIPIEEIQVSVLKYLQTQYNKISDEGNQIYQMLSNNEQFINMLIQYDKGGEHLEQLRQEAKLLDVTHFLKSNSLLIGALPLTQIRQDFYNDKIIERVLQVHGFSEYPRDYLILVDLKYQIDPQSSQDIVIVKVLKHLDKLKYFESENNAPDYLNQMIYETVLIKDEVEFIDQIETILVKILKLQEGIDKQQTKKDIISFLLNNMNKQSSLYYEVCQIFIRTLKEARNSDIYQSLQRELEQGMDNKVKYFIRKLKANLQSNQNQDCDKGELNNQVFIQTMQNIEPFLRYGQIKQLSKLVEVTEDMQIRIKHLKQVDQSQWLEVLNDPDFQIQNQEKYKSENKSTFKQSSSNKIEQESLKDKELEQNLDNHLIELIENIQDEIQVQMIVDMHYKTWDDKFNFQALITDFIRSKLSTLPDQLQELLIDQTLLQTLYSCETLNRENLLKLFNEFDKDHLFCLQILKDLSETGGLSDQDHLESHLMKFKFAGEDIQAQNVEEEQSQKDLNNSNLLKYLGGVLNDSNIIQYMQRLEVLQDETAQRYQVLVALSLYISKLDKFLENYWCLIYLQPSLVEGMVYTLIDKDTLSDLIEKPSAIELINDKFQVNAKISIKSEDYKQELIDCILIK